MKLANDLKKYLDETGESMRSLSLRSGLDAKAVGDIIRIPGYRPSQKSIAALAAVTGLALVADEEQVSTTYADIIQKVTDAGNRRAANRLKWLCERAGWQAQIKVVCINEAKEFLDKSVKAREGLTKGSFSTYKSEVLDILQGEKRRQRARDIRDVGGVHAELFYAVKKAGWPHWKLGQVGPFLCFLADRGNLPSEADCEVLLAYYAHRCNTTPATEKKCLGHVREIAAHFRKLSADPEFARFDLPTLADPFENRVDKFGVDSARLAPLLTEFDEQVVPWVRGKLSRTGQTFDAFLAVLDAEEAAAEAQANVDLSDKTARMLARAAHVTSATAKSKTRSLTGTQKERMVRLGFLVEGTTWSEKTVRTRRGFVIAVAKVLCVLTEEVPESIEELTHPDLLELALTTMRDMNKSEYPSAYTKSVATCMRKLARDFVGRGDEDMKKIDAICSAHGNRKRGIAPRNRAKLREFDEEKVDALINMSDVVVRELNLLSPGKKRRSVGQTDAPLGQEAARDLMATIAHCILLDQAPRSANVVECRLDWIALTENAARIVVPAEAVKMRAVNDEDLIVHLSVYTTRLLRTFLEKVRPHCLNEGDKANPYLFPSQDPDPARGRGKPYDQVLKRTVRLVSKHANADINPHLYRHLLGWIWLRDDLDNLPKVQRLLGHKQIQTTIDFYAELDATLSVESWQGHIEARRRARAGKKEPA